MNKFLIFPIDESHASEAIDIQFHIFILLIFLTAFFFFYISKTIEKEVRHNIGGTLKENTYDILKNIDNVDKNFKEKTGVSFINWDKINQYGETLTETSEKDKETKQRHNKKLIVRSIIIILCILVLLMFTIFYFSIHKRYHVDYTNILLQLFFAFLFIAGVEFLFFKNIAVNYIPINPADISDEVIDRIQYHADRVFS